MMCEYKTESSNNKVSMLMSPGWRANHMLKYASLPGGNDPDPESSTPQFSPTRMSKLFAFGNDSVDTWPVPAYQI